MFAPVQSTLEIIKPRPKGRGPRFVSSNHPKGCSGQVKQLRIEKRENGRADYREFSRRRESVLQRNLRTLVFLRTPCSHALIALFVAGLIDLPAMQISRPGNCFAQNSRFQIFDRVYSRMYRVSRCQRI